MKERENLGIGGRGKERLKELKEDFKTWNMDRMKKDISETQRRKKSERSERDYIQNTWRRRIRRSVKREMIKKQGE